MDIELAGKSQDALEIIISVFVPTFVALVSLAVLALAGAGAWASVQKVARQVRPLVDEPDDYIVVTLDGIGEWALNRKLDEAYISKLLTATVDAIIGQREVAREVELGDAAK